MENRSDLRNRDFRSPDIVSLKRTLHNQDAVSPKFTRKRIDPPNIFTRKTQKNIEPSDAMTYISPKKYLEHQIVGTQSVKSITSFASFSRCQKNKQVSTCYNNNTERDSLSSTSFTDIKISENVIFQSAQQIRSKVRANEQINQLKNKNEGLTKRINQLNQKLKNFKEENNQLYKRIQSFNQVISQKNQIINQFSLMLRQKQRSISIYQTQLQYSHKKCEQQQNIIVLLNKTIEQYSTKSPISASLNDDTDDGQKQLLLSQISNYKEQILELTEQIKYSEIQTSMYQKLRYDYNTQVEKNQNMKAQNKKLIARIQYLVNCAGKDKQQTKPRQSLIHAKNRNRNRKQSEILFQLSPQK